MTLSVFTVLRQSFRRLATGPALLVLLALAVVQAVGALVPGRSFQPAPGPIGAGVSGLPVVFTGNPLPVVASIVSALFTGYLALVTIRVFAGEWGIVEREHLTQDVGWGLANLYALAIVLSLLVSLAGLVGSALGLLGLIALVVFVLSLLFVMFLAPAFVAVENANVVAAIRRSVRATSTAWLQIAAVVAATVLVSVLLSAVAGRVTDALIGTLYPVGVFLGAVLSGAALVFLWITVARAYDELETGSSA